MGYVHGYSDREALRLSDQATALEELLHAGTLYPPGSTVLEAGCGVGAQTLALVRRSPGVAITAVDLSAPSLEVARRRVHEAGQTGVTFRQADVRELPFPDEAFDHAFVCFVLEHLPDPGRALEELRRVLRRTGTLTVIEGDHGSCLFHPRTGAAVYAWECLVRVQGQLGGDPLIGRRLYPLLRDAGFEIHAVAPRVVYADARSPALVENVVRRTLTAMVEGIRDLALPGKILDRAQLERGIADLHALADSPEGTLCYTFFKALAARSASGFLREGRW